MLNSLGARCDRTGRVVRGHLDRETGRHYHLVEELARLREAGGAARPTGGNTTLTVVVTNQRLDYRPLRQFARQVHSSMARAIQPFHTPFDGDVLYAVTTAEVDNPGLDDLSLGAEAAEAVWDAVLSIVEVMGGEH